MSQHFLLPCRECDQKIPILPRHAGEHRVCEWCGANIVVPTLREIRRLPQQESAESVRGKQASHWTFGHGILFSLGIPLILISLGWLGYNAWIHNRINTEAPTVDDLIAVSADKLSRLDFDTLSIVDSYEKVWKPLESLSLRTRPTPAYVQRRAFADRLLRRMAIAGVLAALGFAMVLGALVTSRISGS